MDEASYSAVRSYVDWIKHAKKLYIKWICDNPCRAYDVESTISFFSYIVQGRHEGNSFLLSQLIYSFSNLLGVWHNHLLKKKCEAKSTTSRSSNGEPIASTSAASYYTSLNSETDSSVRRTRIGRIKLILSLIRYVEVFVEVAAKKLWGDAGRWIVILITQSIKTGLRAALLFHYQTGIVETAAFKSLDVKRSKGNQCNYNSSMVFRLQHSGRVIRKISAAPPLAIREWKVPDTSCENLSKRVKLQPHRLTAETLRILKPLSHLAALSMWGSKSWKAWALCLALDASCLQLHGSVSKMKPHEKSELNARYYALLYYLFRSPFYDKITKRKLMKAFKFFNKLPLVGRIFEATALSVPDWENTYFYMWHDT